MSVASIITFLIYVCVLALVIYLIIWVLRDVLGLPIPEKVIQILWVIVALIVILWLVQMVLGGGSFKLGNPFRSGIFGGGAFAALSTPAPLYL
jgi:chromate transport protein ChrA